MSVRCFLYLNAQQTTAFRWRAGVLSEDGAFAAGDSGRFVEYLEANPKCIFTILANVADEGFQVETIPLLRGADRRAVIARKLGQQFFNAILTASSSLGHEQSRRKNERVLLAALTGNETFSPWLQALASTEAALTGIYSLPLLQPLLVRRLAITDERCLLLTVQDQSIRQSYLEKGELQFSRLSVLQDDSAGSMARAFASEARKLQQYLISQRLIGRQQPITAYLLVHASAREAVRSICVTQDTLSFVILDIEQCAQRCRVRTPPPDTRCELLFLQLLATDRPRTQFASDSLRHAYHLRRVRSLLHGVAASVLLTCLLYAGNDWYQAKQLDDEVEAVNRETFLAQQRYDAILRTFPPIPTTSENLRLLINRYLELEKGSRSPDLLWREISQALQGEPSVEVDGIDWRMTSPTPGEAVPGELQHSELPSSEGELAIVRGTLRVGANSSNRRQVLAAFNRLLAALQRNPSLTVEVLQQPFDIESGKLVQGGDVGAEDGRLPSFKLRIRRTIAT